MRRTRRTALLLLFALVLPTAAAAHGSLHERITAMDRQMATHPDQAESLLRRAELHREHGDFQAAIVDIQRARELEPTLSVIDLQLARVYLDQGRLDAARAAAMRFLADEQGATDTGNLVPRAHELLAEIALQQGDGLGAANHLASAITSAERPAPTLYLLRAEALAQAGPDRTAEAVGALDEGIQRLGPLPALQQRALELQIAEADYGAALKRIQTMIAAAPRDPSLRIRQASIHELAGQPDQALQSYLDARRLLTEGPSLRRNSPAMRAQAAQIDAAMVRLSRPDSTTPR